MVQGQQALLPIGGHHTNAVERGPVNQLRADDRINQHILFLIHRSVDLKRLENSDAEENATVSLGGMPSGIVTGPTARQPSEKRLDPLRSQGRPRSPPSLPATGSTKHFALADHRNARPRSCHQDPTTENLY